MDIMGSYYPVIKDDIGNHYELHRITFNKTGLGRTENELIIKPLSKVLHFSRDDVLYAIITRQINHQYKIEVVRVQRGKK